MNRRLLVVLAFVVALRRWRSWHHEEALWLLGHSRIGTAERPDLEVPMRRFSKLVILVAMTAAVTLSIGSVAAAATAGTYNIAGVEYATTTFPASNSFAGAAVSTPSRTEYGVWNAVVVHDLGGIVGGTFAFKSKIHILNASIAQGSFGPAVGTCAKSTIPIQANLVGGAGSFEVTLTRYGYMSGGACVVYLATVRGTATLTFP